MQLLGPDDTYLVQSDEDDTKFWGWKYAQGLGCTFEWKEEEEIDDSAKQSIAAMTPEEWRDRVKTGFQILPFHLQGRLDGHDGTQGGVKSNQGVAGKAEYDISLRPVAGWGQYPPLSSQLQHQNETSTKQTYSQFSTAGWLAKFPVFEPHWQITMAHARATGSINWNGTVYEFKDAPFYGEKNWGGAFPTKWYWSQCNSFDDYPDLSFTAGGGIRILPFSFLPGKRTETLGLIGIHYQGSFYEFVPWTSESEWEVDPWGTWKFRGRCTDKGKKFEADIVVTTDEDVPGVLLRAPTKDEGMQYFCRDSGFGNAVVSLCELEWDDNARDYIRATSRQCTVEVGGGPWWSTWKVKSQMSPILKKLIRLPYAFRRS
ncbi:tocopherol cyclase [Skeletonema marinoi]|uniref:Tocopherol cyclase n=1 Tax=Skeletonema marinoi TaxID=267567 RepID=A0AAD8YDH8_9STRA|nr:tocopherol cyclase [Skeletonema marinoi]